MTQEESIKVCTECAETDPKKFTRYDHLCDNCDDKLEKELNS